ncbi:nicotinamide N-methyltransferase-like [Spea bombifrons]|uniref:nicotinamide N-methyltransferase-like n=1 Tax=Spea bombifrons TaxID=233779 RepID=UPI00234A47C2|nr:nicotinamide N-methyltransferase-like [Spea bombifrons]
MSSTDLKYYHEHAFEPKHFLDAYFSPKTDEALLEDVFLNPMECLHKELMTGHIYGDLLLDVSVGPSIFHLLAICKFFKKIAVLEFNDLCILELEKWLNSHEEAYDWSHASKVMIDLVGTSDGQDTIEELLRSKIKRVLKCDLAKDNPTEPTLLPKAVISAWGLEIVSKDKNHYINNFRKISSLLKQGGRLILFGSFNVSYYKIAEQTFGILTYDEEFFRKVLKEEGYSIEVFQAKNRKTMTDIADYEKIFFVVAIKQRKG